jgi:hypothetical protein
MLRSRLIHAHFGRGGTLALPIARALERPDIRQPNPGQPQTLPTTKPAAPTPPPATLDPTLMSDEELRPFYNEVMARKMREYRARKAKTAAARAVKSRAKEPHT